MVSEARQAWEAAPGEASTEQVQAVLSRVADAWTLWVVEALVDGPRRFGAIAKEVPGISQKMLTKTLRGLERDGLATRTVFPVVPPHVEYELTPLGLSLAEALCGVWLWVERHGATMEAARADFDAKQEAVG